MTHSVPPKENDSGGDDELSVREDPDLLPEEKQLSIVTTKEEDRLKVFSKVASVNRGLLSNPHVEVTGTRRVDGAIVAVEATIPRNLLLVKAVARSDDSWHHIVANGGDDE